ncbi:FkbM family methyltransferase [uncultured Helicobacter sp.]|uniref:FkbM family methyltransferase n=1 Tax=uncultured Helicobacter sp. TaxID=175537 RepID=UPI00374E97D9
MGKKVLESLRHIPETLWIGSSGMQAEFARDIATDPDLKAKVLTLCAGLDPKSIETITRILSRMRTAYTQGKPYCDTLTNEETQEIARIREEFYPKVRKVAQGLYYTDGFLSSKPLDACVILCRHHLHHLHASTLEAIRHKDIIDVGASFGDSALVFQGFSDKNIYSFEPTSEGYEALQETIKLNNATRIIPVKKALGASKSQGHISINGGCSSMVFDNHTTTQEVEVITLDSFVREHNIQVGFIKVDIEGFEQEFLKGAKETIIAQKPAMLISIYHKASDFFEIKPMIESWKLGYTFKVVQPSAATRTPLIDTVLLCEVDSLITLNSDSESTQDSIGLDSNLKSNESRF